MSKGPNAGKVTGNRRSSKRVKLTEQQKVLMGKGRAASFDPYKHVRRSIATSIFRSED